MTEPTAFVRWRWRSPVNALLCLFTIVVSGVSGLSGDIPVPKINCWSVSECTMCDSVPANLPRSDVNMTKQSKIFGMFENEEKACRATGFQQKVLCRVKNESKILSFFESCPGLVQTHTAMSVVRFEIAMALAAVFSILMVRSRKTIAINRLRSAVHRGGV